MTNSEQMIRSYIDRIMTLKAEQDTIGEDVRSVYKEAADNGFDKTALGKVVTHLRRYAKDAEKAGEIDDVVQTYLAAYGVPSHVHAREAA
jgi:uncharacterized protein (UPF0335 family)